MMPSTGNDVLPYEWKADHQIRITSAGSIKGYVKFALNHLETQSSKTIEFHTKPSSSSSSSPCLLDKSASTTTKQNAVASSSSSSSTLQSCTLNIPKLISVVELVKRNHIENLKKSGKGKGKHQSTGIWQYTKSGLINPEEIHNMKDLQEGGGNKEVRESTDLTRLLQGKTKAKMTHYPYLSVILSTKPLGLEKGNDISCQHALVGRRHPAEQRKRPVVGISTDIAVDAQVEGMEDVGEPIAAPITPVTIKEGDIGTKKNKEGRGQTVKRTIPDGRSIRTKKQKVV